MFDFRVPSKFRVTKRTFSGTPLKFVQKKTVAKPLLAGLPSSTTPGKR